MLVTPLINRLFPILIVLFLWASPAWASQPPWATGESRGQDLDIELLTFGVGDDVPSWFGHTALAVRDRRLQVERVYNFGMFSFGSDMLPKFLMGRLEFWVGQASYARTISIYQSLDRDVSAQILNLSPERRLEVAKFLAWNVLPENRDYLYDHFFDNCATRIRDIIDRSTDGQFKKTNAVSARMTLRDHVHRHTERLFYLDMVLTFWMNGRIDDPILQWDEMFLPSELELRVGKQQYVNEAGDIVPLVAETRVIYTAKNRDPVPQTPSTKVPWLVMFGALLGGLAYWLAQRLALRRKRGEAARGARVAFGGVNVFAGLLVGIPGLIVPFFNVTDHLIAHDNLNVLFASPLTFLALPLGMAVMFGWGRAEKWLGASWKIMVVASLVGMVVSIFVQQVMRLPMALMVPINLGFALAFMRLQRTA